MRRGPSPVDDSRPRTCRGHSRGSIPRYLTLTVTLQKLSAQGSASQKNNRSAVALTVIFVKASRMCVAKRVFSKPPATVDDFSECYGNGTTNIDACQGDIPSDD